MKQLIARQPNLKSKLIDEFTISEAFEYKGEKYYMFKDPVDVTTGRGLYSMTIYEEMMARVDREYLQFHVEAMDKVFSDPSKTNIAALVRLNDNLKERLAFQIHLPEHVYKLASIIFFTEDESPYRYNDHYNKRKIDKWKKDPDMYGFFLQTPLKQLIPSLDMPLQGTQAYFRAVEKIKTKHLNYVRQAALGKT